EGRSSGLRLRRQSRRAALRLAVKYSDSARWYISRAASNAMACRSLSLAILAVRRILEARFVRRGAEHILPPAVPVRHARAHAGPRGDASPQRTWKKPAEAEQRTNPLRQ